MTRQDDVQVKTWLRYTILVAFACTTTLLGIGLAVFLAGPFKERSLQLSTRVELAELAELYRAEKNYFAEHGRYELDFEKIGFRPTGDLRYVVSFIPACASRHGYLDSSVTSTIDFTSRGIASVVTHNKLSKLDLDKVRTQLDELSTYNCPHPADGFVAVAIGNIDSDSDLDVWIVDDKKNLQNLKTDF